MEFIICNEKGEEITLLTDAQYIDMEIGDGNTFSIEISKEYQKRWGIDSGWRIGCPGKEYGGIIDKIVSTDNILTISGATWRGLLTKKILQPPSGDDYLIVSGDADKIIDETICSQFDGIFVCNTTSGVEYSGFKFDRYVDSLAGIEKMLLSKNLRLSIEYDSGKANESSFVRIRSTPIHDFSDEIEYSKDGTLSYIYFSFEKFTGGINHLICLGKGELKDRLVLHLYADADGNISDKQSLFGKDERVTVYDYSNASSEEELREKGTERLKELLSYKSMDMDLFNESLAGLRGVNDDISIGDIVGGRDFDTGIYLSKQITRKIVQVKNGKESIEYSVGKPVLNRNTANSPVEQSRSLTEKDVVDNLLSTATNLPLSANQGYVLKNMINTQAAKLNSAWIDLNGTSIFDYFPYNDKTGIYSCFNATELPSVMTSSHWFVVLKSHEKLIIFHDTGIFFSSAHGGQWTRVWKDYLRETGQPTVTSGLFSSTQIRYSKTGCTTTVYVSVKTEKDMPVNTAFTISNLPPSWVEENFRVDSAFGRGVFEVQVNGTNANITNTTKVGTGYWIRFMFSYITAN